MSTNTTNLNQPSETAQAQMQSNNGNSASFSSLGIRNNNINEAEGVKLSDKQKVIAGSVLDLFEGNPTLKHFSLWNPEAIFEDPITKAAGESKYKAQWYGLPAVFHPIKLQSHKVIDSGNPMRLEVSNKYVVRGIGKEQVINSVVEVFLNDQNGRIDKVLDKWNGKLPENVVVDAFRKLNAVTVPMFVTVPKTEEEDMKMKAARDKENEKK
ncbi:hypothetical protein PspLS_10216 [Pyricularia sp. CBS 133598]|nr:hypothetical protein PspLS_10216 [Pyricularia sp. CBS 133598]